MACKLGLLDQIALPDTLPAQQALANTITYAQAAEHAGFYHFQVAEHHYSKEWALQCAGGACQLAAVLKQNTIVFESYAELQQREVTMVYLQSEKDNEAGYPLFDWLVPTQQPLYFLETASRIAIDLLCEAGKIQ